MEQTVALRGKVMGECVGGKRLKNFYGSMHNRQQCGKAWGKGKVQARGDQWGGDKCYTLNNKNFKK